MDFHDYEAEQKFVSCVMADPDVLLELNAEPQWFSLRECRDIVTGAKELANKGVDYERDPEPLLHWLTDSGYSRADALKSVADYAGDYVPAFHAAHYLGRVQTAYRQRQIKLLSERIIQAAASGDDNILSRARAALDELERRTVSDKTTTITAEYLLTTDFPEPKWIVPGILPAGLAFLAGKPKAGKSWLALQLSHAVGIGGMFMGKQIAPKKVLYLALEDSPRRLATRMKFQDWNKAAQVRFITPNEHAIVGPLEKGGVDKILALIARHKFGLVIIDTLTRAIDSDQFSPQDMKRTLSPLQSGALKYDACVLLIDHMPKLSGTEEDVINDVYGSISKVGIADTIMGFYRDRGTNTGKLAGVGRDIEEFSFALKYIQQNGAWVQVNDAERARYSEQRHEILQYVKDAKNASVTHVAVELGINKGTASRVLKELASDNLVITFNEGRHVVYGVSQVGQTVLGRWNERVEAAKQILLTD